MTRARIDKLTSRLTARLKNLNWSHEALYLGLRARFRCEYCGRSLLRSIENHDTWCNDHVLPKSRGGSDDFRRNKALSCRLCNRLKRNSVPRGAGASVDRETLLTMFRPLINDRRKTMRRNLAVFRRALDELRISYS